MQPPSAAAAHAAAIQFLNSPAYVLGKSLAKIIDEDNVEAVTNFIRALPAQSRQEVVGHALTTSSKASIQKIQAILAICPGLLQHANMAIHLLEREDYPALEQLYQQGWRATPEIRDEWEQFVAVNLDDEDEDQPKSEEQRQKNRAARKMEAELLARLPPTDLWPGFSNIRILQERGNKLIGTFFSPILQCQLFVKTGDLRLEEHDAIQHEAFIGLFATNYLNVETPNFARVVGYQPRVPTRTGGVGNVVYYEYIHGIPWSDFDETSTFLDYRAALIQIIFALHNGYRRFQFDHRDLHSENILVTPEIISLRLGPEQVVQSNFRPVILDFDNSRVVLGGVSYEPEDARTAHPERDWFQTLQELFKETRFKLDIDFQSREREDTLAYLTDPSLTEEQTAYFQEALQYHERMLRLGRQAESMAKFQFLQTVSQLAAGSETVEAFFQNFVQLLRT